mgnify:CR=1 FL=1
MKHKIFALLLSVAISSTLVAQSPKVDSRTTVKTVTTTVTETTADIPAPAAPKTKKVAIFVRNDSGAQALDAKTKALEFSISSRINNAGFSVINQDLAIRSLNDYLGDPNAKYRTLAAAAKKNLETKEPLGSALFGQSSAARIGELIGADYILSVSISSFGSEKKIFGGYFVNTENVNFKLRSNYNLYTCSDGGTAGNSVTAAKTIRRSENLSIDNSDIVDELLDSTAESMAALLSAQNKGGQIAAAQKTQGELEILFEIRDLSMPEIVSKDGKYVLGSNSIPVRIAYVNAEIDGISRNIGEKIKLTKGLHTFRISQKDIEPLEKNINVTGDANQRIAFSLQLDDNARNRFKNDMAFIEQMKAKAQASDNARILTEAEADKIRGIAKMFEQSGFKVDAKALPEINKTQSIFGQ